MQVEGAWRGENTQISETGGQRVYRWHEQKTFFGQFFAHASYLGNDACEAQIGARYDRLAFTVAVATAGGEDGSDSHIDK